MTGTELPVVVSIGGHCLVLCYPSCCLLLYSQMRCEFPRACLSYCLLATVGHLDTVSIE